MEFAYFSLNVVRGHCFRINRNVCKFFGQWFSSLSSFLEIGLIPFGFGGMILEWVPGAKSGMSSNLEFILILVGSRSNLGFWNPFESAVVFDKPVDPALVAPFFLEHQFIFHNKLIFGFPYSWFLLHLLKFFFFSLLYLFLTEEEVDSFLSPRSVFSDKTLQFLQSEDKYYQSLSRREQLHRSLRSYRLRGRRWSACSAYFSQ